jgi:hypothetical protein
MDIHNIKPPGGYEPPAGPDEQPVDGKRDGSFPAKGKVGSSDPTEVAPPTLSVVSQFSRTELDDPAKMDGMVRASVSELVDSGMNVTGPLSSTEKQSLVEFLSSDPLVRRQVESYLRKALV